MWPFSSTKSKILPVKPDPYKIDIKTGGGQLRSGRHGLEHEIAEKMYNLRRSAFGGVSPADRQFLIDLITKHAKLLPFGSGFPRVVRLSMKEEVERAYRAGKLSHEDKEKFNKIIDNLPHE